MDKDASIFILYVLKKTEDKQEVTHKNQILQKVA